MSNTNTKGVDIILNCSTEQLSNVTSLSTIKYLADNGSYIEVYLNNVLSDMEDDSEMQQKNCSFHRILPDVLINASEHTKCQTAEFLRKGKLIPNGLKTLKCCCIS